MKPFQSKRTQSHLTTKPPEMLSRVSLCTQCLQIMFVLILLLLPGCVQHVDDDSNSGCSFGGHFCMSKVKIKSFLLFLCHPPPLKHYRAAILVLLGVGGVGDNNSPLSVTRPGWVTPSHRTLSLIHLQSELGIGGHKFRRGWVSQPRARGGIGNRPSRSRVRG